MGEGRLGYVQRQERGRGQGVADGASAERFIVPCDLVEHCEIRFRSTDAGIRCSVRRRRSHLGELLGDRRHLCGEEFAE